MEFCTFLDTFGELKKMFGNKKDAFKITRMQNQKTHLSFCLFFASFLMSIKFNCFSKCFHYAKIIKRYILFLRRLTPAYLAMIGLYSTWFIRLGSGPLWESRISIEQQRCQESWWKNLLYINNYYGNDMLCMFQSWYLAGKL